MSCGDDYYTLKNDEQNLCDKLWIDQNYVTEDGYEGTYQLRFYQKDYKGQEITSYSEGGGTHTFDREFSWKWGDSSKEDLYMTFNDGSIKHFENVLVRNHYLSGLLDGESIMLVDMDHIN